MGGKPKSEENAKMFPSKCADCVENETGGQGEAGWKEAKDRHSK